MQWPYLILDQNVIGNPNALADASKKCKENNWRLVVPDVCAVEWSKGDMVDLWMRRLTELSSHSESVVQSRPLRDMLREERETGEPVITIIHDECTEYLQQTLRDIHYGREELVRERLVGANIQRRCQVSSETWFSEYSQSKVVLYAAYNNLRQILTSDEISQLRRSPESEMQRAIALPKIYNIVLQYLSRVTTSLPVIVNLAYSRSVNAAFVIGILSICLNWISYGGFNSAKNNVISNDMLDLEYSILAIMSQDLLSCDKRQRRIFELMKSAICPTSITVL